MKRSKDDVLWSDLVKERDGWMCRRCGKPFAEGYRRGLDAHHIFTRSRRSTRHMLLNGVSLCTGCHMWAHRNPLEFHEWAKDQLGELEYDELQHVSRELKK